MKIILSLTADHLGAWATVADLIEYEALAIEAVQRAFPSSVEVELGENHKKVVILRDDPSVSEEEAARLERQVETLLENL